MVNRLSKVSCKRESPHYFFFLFFSKKKCNFKGDLEYFWSYIHLYAEIIFWHACWIIFKQILKHNNPISIKFYRSIISTISSNNQIKLAESWPSLSGSLLVFHCCQGVWHYSWVFWVVSAEIFKCFQLSYDCLILTSVYASAVYTVH